MIKKFLRLNPITRRRLQRFRRIKTGYFALWILVIATFLSLFSEFIANNRAIVVNYEGEYYFPTFTFYSGETFGQEDPYGFVGAEANYRKLSKKWEESKSGNWVLLPPVPFNPIENDYDYYKSSPPHPPDSRHILGTDMAGRDVFARLLYGFRISIFFAVTMVFFSMVVGTVIGSFQGYLGGKFDITSQRFIEIWSTLPFLYVVVLLAALI